MYYKLLYFITFQFKAIKDYQIFHKIYVSSLSVRIQTIAKFLIHCLIFETAVKCIQFHPLTNLPCSVVNNSL